MASRKDPTRKWVVEWLSEKRITGLPDTWIECTGSWMPLKDQRRWMGGLLTLEDALHVVSMERSRDADFYLYRVKDHVTGKIIIIP